MIGGRLAAGGHREADRAVLGLDLDDQRAQHVDAEALARLAIFRIARHRRGDVIVDPVAFALVVIIGPAAADDIGTHCLIFGKAGSAASTPFCGNHIAPRSKMRINPILRRATGDFTIWRSAMLRRFAPLLMLYFLTL
jgi:hypothetical protein